MTDAQLRSFQTEFDRLTAEYLGELESCVGCLRPLIRTYGDEPDEFDRQVTAIHARESACDDLLRELRTLLGESMPANFTGVFLLPGEVVSLFGRIDAVANAVERVAVDLATMRPPVSDPVRDDLLVMVSYTEAATTRLTEATAALAAHLCEPGADFDATADVGAIRRLEGQADEIEQRLLGDAFADGSSLDALVVRELLVGFDAIPDAIEDAADHLVYVQSAGV